MKTWMDLGKNFQTPSRRKFPNFVSKKIFKLSRRKCSNSILKKGWRPFKKLSKESSVTWPQGPHQKRWNCKGQKETETLCIPFKRFRRPREEKIQLVLASTLTINAYKRHSSHIIIVILGRGYPCGLQHPKARGNLKGHYSLRSLIISLIHIGATIHCDSYSQGVIFGIPGKSYHNDNWMLVFT